MATVVSMVSTRFEVPLVVSGHHAGRSRGGSDRRPWTRRDLQPVALPDSRGQLEAASSAALSLSTDMSSSKDLANDATPSSSSVRLTSAMSTPTLARSSITW